MIYILSDIHGQYDRFKKMLERIGFSSSDTLYVLGDVIDRGPDSIEMLLDIMGRENVVMFLGNHEHMMLTYLEKSDTASWFYGVNGGRQTYFSFLEQDKKTQERIVDFLLNDTLIKKDLFLGDKRYILSHTGVLTEEGDVYTRDHKNDLMGIQDFIWNMSYPNTSSIEDLPKTEKETIFVSGHIITRRITGEDEVYTKFYPNNYSWYDIDCGCAMGKGYGYLACLAIGDDGVIKDIYYVR